MRKSSQTQTSLTRAERDFGEATVTGKGQITVPNALRHSLSIGAGDRLRFVQAPEIDPARSPKAT